MLDVRANHLEGADAMISHGRDVTARVAAEEDLQAERTDLAAIFEASPVAMLVCDQDANVVRVNRATLRPAARDAETLIDHQPDSSVQYGDVLACARRRCARPRACRAQRTRAP